MSCLVLGRWRASTTTFAACDASRHLLRVAAATDSARAGRPIRRAPWVTWQGLLGAAARQHLCAGRPLQPPRRGCQHQARAGTGGCFLPCAGLGGLPASVVEAGSQAARRWHRGGAPGPSGSAAAHSRRSAAVSGRLPRALTARKDGESLVSFKA